MTGLVWTPKPVEIPGAELEYLGPYGLVTVKQMPLITVGTGWYEDLRIVAKNGRRRNPIPGGDSACNPVEFGVQTKRPGVAGTTRGMAPNTGGSMQAKTTWWGTTRNCENCGGEFVLKVRESQRFCSHDCSAILRYGPRATPLPAIPWQERFFRYYPEPGPNGCREWTGSRDKHGYGRLNRGRKGSGIIKAHRASWEIHNGPIPDGIDVLHKCDNPPCCNPDCLFLGTHQDNMDDRSAKGRVVSPTGMGNGKAVYTDAVIREIRELAAAGESYDALAERFGLTSKYICAVVLGRRRAAAGGPIRV